jgi:hypothetical protein
MLENQVQLRLRLDDDASLAAALEVAQEVPEASAEIVNAESEGPAEQIEPVTAILIGAAVLAAAKFIQNWWERARGGLVIDLRATATEQIYRTKKVPYGYVVTLPAAGGTVTIDVKDEPKDSIERLISALVTGVLGDVDEVKHAVNELLPNAEAHTSGEVEKV